MTKREKFRLAKQIAQIAEKAYRRGFQHGHGAALGKLGADPPTVEEVARWRFSKGSNNTSTAPPGTHYIGRKENLITRLSMEVDYFRHDIIHSILRDVEDMLLQRASRSITEKS